MSNTKIMIQFNVTGITAFEVDAAQRPTGRTFDVVGVLGTTFTQAATVQQATQPTVQQPQVVAQIAATVAPVAPSAPVVQQAPVNKSTRILSAKGNGVKYLVNGIEFYAGYTNKTAKFVTWTNSTGYKDAVKGQVVKSLGDQKLFDIANAVAATQPLPESVPQPQPCSICGTLVKSPSVLQFSDKKFGKVICYTCQNKPKPGASEASAQHQVPVIVQQNTAQSATVNQCAPGADVLNAVFSGASEASAPTTPQLQTSIPVPNQCAAPGVDAGQVILSEPVISDSWSDEIEYEVSDDYINPVYDDTYFSGVSNNPSSQEGSGEVIQTSLQSNPLVVSPELQAQLDVLNNLSQASPTNPSSPVDTDES